MKKLNRVKLEINLHIKIQTRLAIYNHFSDYLFWKQISDETGNKIGNQVREHLCKEIL